MQTQAMANDPTTPAVGAVITDRDGKPVVSVAALLARLDMVDQWEDLNEVRDVLRTIVGGEPRLGADRRIRPEFRQHDQAQAWATISRLLEEWAAGTDPDRAGPEALGRDRRRALVVERRRLRALKIGRWDELRIRWEGIATGTLEGRVGGDDELEAWTYVSRLDSDAGRRDQVLRGLLKDAEEDGYDPAIVQLDSEADHG